MNYLDSLNKEQREAAEHINGPCLVTAGAGTGKTSALTARIANLVDNGVNPENILAITFTNKAAKEMKDRANKLADCEASTIKTFHSFGLDIVKYHSKELGFTKSIIILDPDDTLKIIKELCNKRGVGSKKLKELELGFGDVACEISRFKNTLATGKDIKNELAMNYRYLTNLSAQIYDEYRKYCLDHNYVDFDDLLILPLKLFRYHPEILDRYQEKYKYILVDEYQDTNTAQYELLKILASKYRNLFVVGDINQCLTAHSLVKTPEGNKYVKRIKEGDYILTGNGKGNTSYQKVEHIFIHYYVGKLLTIKTASGKKLTLTPNHTCLYKASSKKQARKINISYPNYFYQSPNNILNIDYLSGQYGKRRDYCAQRITFTTTDRKVTTILKKLGFEMSKISNKYKVVINASSGKEIEEIADKILVAVPDTTIHRTMKLTNGEAYNFIKAENLMEGMFLPILEDGKIVGDQIISIDSHEEEQAVYDFSIPTTRNFIVNNICVHNCIYGFRNADYRNVLNFKKDYPDVKEVTLNQNYRSTNTILQAANSVIKNNAERADVTLHSQKGLGKNIQHFDVYSEHQEASKVMSEINYLIDFQGYKPSDIAILYRSNYQSNIYESYLQGIAPFKVVGNKFFDRAEIKDLVAYLRVIVNEDDDLAVKRIINVPKRGIGDATIEKLEQAAIEQNTSLFNAKTKKEKEAPFKKLINSIKNKIQGLNVIDITEIVLNDSGLIDMYKEINDIKAKIKIENLEEFKNVSFKYYEEHPSSTLSEMLEDLGLLDEIDTEQNNDDCITLMTLHKSKGLEFPVVFIVGAEQRVFLSKDATQQEIEEERRLIYVGLTRAKERLYISNAHERKKNGEVHKTRPVTFINEIDYNCIDKYYH